MDVLGIYEQYENTADSVFQITLKSGRVITIHPKDDIWAWGGAGWHTRSTQCDWRKE